MPDTDTFVNDWAQLALFPQGVVELTLRVGIAYDADHVQMQVDVRDPSSGQLIAMRSRPHMNLEMADGEIRKWSSEFLAEVLDHLSPFPE